MSYFPAFLKLDNKKILIVGGGNVAYEKLDHLLDFTNDIFVIAPEISLSMQTLIDEKGLNSEKRVYQTGDIKEYAIVIVAVDNLEDRKSVV